MSVYDRFACLFLFHGGDRVAVQITGATDFEEAVWSHPTITEVAGDVRNERPKLPPVAEVMPELEKKMNRARWGKKND